MLLHCGRDSDVFFWPRGGLLFGLFALLEVTPRHLCLQSIHGRDSVVVPRSLWSGWCGDPGEARKNMQLGRNQFDQEGHGSAAAQLWLEVQGKKGVEQVVGQKRQ